MRSGITYLAFLDEVSDPCLRSSVTGHLTGSVVVFDASLSYVLLTLHPRVGRWLQLGGHCEESDETIRDVAAREGWEESGIPDLRVTAMPVRLDTHPITCSLGVPTRHLDVQFAAVAPADRRWPTTRGDAQPRVHGPGLVARSTTCRPTWVGACPRSWRTGSQPSPDDWQPIGKSAPPIRFRRGFRAVPAIWGTETPMVHRRSRGDSRESVVTPVPRP